MTDLQIDFIRAFGDKELKFGCVYKLHWEYRKMSWVPAKIDKRYVKILWSEPHLFPDVAKKLKEKGIEVWAKTLDVNKRCLITVWDGFDLIRFKLF